ncbi:hypothetical protein CALCODRAFT_490953 [Calocera cornea HHB12733]|uniref:phosphatidylinositol-3,4,5-trisphosphate 3-phosphatase n=1 Tax=Calocera cornea HHB12733 TaxID=1353952 RepID=A0A165JDL9_9BASI|nr:hypothetical protein CALCODRAFT_490953 [Calocera cornea HHB12733]
MGYPATGVAAMYRNDRREAKKFIEHRHGDKYWVFNFCPLTENAYDPAFFNGHVSRYPFPDHHAPPLALLALAVREMHAWLSADPERVIVVHCKAGKGRSGTLACAYLLTLEAPPAAPKLQRSVTTKEWAARRAEELLERAEEELTEDEGMVGEVGGEVGSLKSVQRAEVPVLAPSLAEDAEGGVEARTDTPQSMGSTEGPPLAALTASSSGPLTPEPIPRSASPSLESVLDLHTQRRMRSKRARTGAEGSPVRRKYGVSISSQRRFLQYWALLLSGTFPPRFWAIPPVPVPPQNVLLKSLTIRMKPAPRAGRTTLSLLSAALSLSRFSQTAAGEVWASISRYDPGFEEALEAQERATRDVEKGVGRCKDGGGLGLGQELESGEWDKRKMVRGFARVGSASPATEKDGILTYSLLPIPPEQWVKVNKAERKSAESRPSEEQQAPEPATTEAPAEAAQQDADDESYDVASMQSTLSSQPGVYSSRSILLEEQRAVRVKLFHRQVPMGWFWFIPAFEMMHASDGIYRYKLERSDLDFALGPGAWIVDVETEMQWA